MEVTFSLALFLYSRVSLVNSGPVSQRFKCKQEFIVQNGISIFQKNHSQYYRTSCIIQKHNWYTPIRMIKIQNNPRCMWAWGTTRKFSLCLFLRPFLPPIICFVCVNVCVCACIDGKGEYQGSWHRVSWLELVSSCLNSKHCYLLNHLHSWPLVFT